MSVTWNSSKQSSHASSKIAPRGQDHRIGVGDRAAGDLLTKAVHPLMHVRHEFVEMRAALVTDRARLEEQIHQHGLAAADLAVDVKPLDLVRLLAVAEQPAEQSALARGGR